MASSGSARTERIARPRIRRRAQPAAIGAPSRPTSRRRRRTASNDVWLARRSASSPLAALIDRVPARREKTLDEHQVRRAADPPRARRAAASLARAAPPVAPSRPPGKSDDESRAAMRAVAPAIRSAVIDDDAVHHGEPEARPFALVLRRPERIPDLATAQSRECRARCPRPRSTTSARSCRVRITMRRPLRRRRASRRRACGAPARRCSAG